MSSEIYFNDSNMDFIEMNILGHEFIHDFSIGIVDRLEKLSNRIKKLNKTIKMSFQSNLKGGGKGITVNLSVLSAIGDTITSICNDIINVLINEHVIHVDKMNIKQKIPIQSSDITILNKMLKDIEIFQSKFHLFIKSFDNTNNDLIDVEIKKYQDELNMITEAINDTHDSFIFKPMLTGDSDKIEFPENMFKYDHSFNEQMEYENIFVGKSNRNKLTSRELIRITDKVRRFINIMDKNNYGPVSNYRSDGVIDFIRTKFHSIDRLSKPLFVYINPDNLISVRNRFRYIYNKARVQKLIIHNHINQSLNKNINYQLENISDDLRVHNTIDISKTQLLIKKNKDNDNNHVLYDNVASHLMDTMVLNDDDFLTTISSDPAKKYDHISHASLLFLNYYYDAFVEQSENEWDNRLSHCALLDNCIMEHKLKLFGYIIDNKSLHGGKVQLERNDFKLQKYTKKDDFKDVDMNMDKKVTNTNVIHHENILYAFYACIQSNKNDVVHKLYDLYYKLYLVYYEVMKNNVHPIHILNSDRIIFMLKLGFINEFKQNTYILELANIVPLYSDKRETFSFDRPDQSGGVRILTRNRNISLRELRVINRNENKELVEMSKIIEEKKRLRKRINDHLKNPTVVSQELPERNAIEMDEIKETLKEQFHVDVDKDDEIFKLMFDSNQYIDILNKKEILQQTKSDLLSTPEFIITDLLSRNSHREKYLQVKHTISECEEKYTSLVSIKDLPEIVDLLLSIDEHILYIKEHVTISYLKPISTYIERKSFPSINAIKSEEDVIELKMTMMNNLNDVFVYVNNIINRIDLMGDVCNVKITDISYELESFGKHIVYDSMFELFNTIKKAQDKVLDLHDRETINQIAQMISRIAMKYALGRNGHSSMKMSKEEIITYIKDESSESPLNRFNNDFLKLQMNILSVWALYTDINLLGEFTDKSNTIFPDFSLENISNYSIDNYDDNILRGFIDIISSNSEYSEKRIYNNLLQRLVEQPKFVNSKFVINNSADLSNAKLLQSSDNDEDANKISYLKSKYFCPLSSVIDAQVSCNLNMAINRDGAEFGSFHFKITNMNKSRHYEVKSLYQDHLYNDKKDSQYLYCTNEITLKNENIYIPLSFNTYLYNFKHDENDDNTYEKMINSMKGAELSARNVYKMLIHKITDMITNKYDDSYKMHDIWNSIETTEYKDILKVSIIKSSGDIFQEMNTITKHGAYIDVEKKSIPNIKNAKTLFDQKYNDLDNAKKVVKYKSSGDALRVGVMGDRPSGTRLAFILLNATDESDINELSLGGFVSPMVGLKVEAVEDGKVVTKVQRHVESKNTLLVGRNLAELHKLLQRGGKRNNNNNRKTRKKR